MDKFQQLLDAINDLSTQAKLGLLVAVFLVLCGGYWLWFWKPKVERLNRLKVQIQREEKLLNEYKLIADELPEFEKQYALLTRQFEIASQKLPTQSEIPALIDSIYGAVNEAGLRSNAFTPKGEVVKEIYAEIPIEMSVYGSYVTIAKFFDRVSRLSRIVNIRDLDFKRPRGAADSTVLEASFTAVTFRMIEQQQQPQPQTQKRPSRGKRKR